MIRLDRNEFLIPHHPRVLQAIERLAGDLAAQLTRYERPEQRDEFLAHLARHLGLPTETRGVLGHGAEEILSRLFLWARNRKTVAFVSPLTWDSYFRLAACAQFDWRPIETTRAEDGAFSCKLDSLSKDLAGVGGEALVLLTSPNNPSGYSVAPDAVEALCRRFPRSLFVVDTVYDALPSPLLAPLATLENAVVIGSFSKFFALPGMRLGFAFGGGLPEGLEWELGFPPGWFDIARAALSEHAHYARARGEMRTFLRRVSATSYQRFQVIPSEAPFLLAQVRGEALAEAERLRREDAAGIIPKYFSKDGYGDFVRFALGTADINYRVETFLGDHPKTK